MATESDRIAGTGATVTFLDGTERTLHFGFLAMKFVEDEMGGLLGALEAFGVRFDEEAQETRRYGVVKMEVAFTTAAKAIACGIAEDFIDAKGRLPQFDTVLTWVLRNADPARLGEYVRVGFDALSDAIPNMNAGEEAQEPDPTPAAPPPPPANGSHHSAFPGATTTTSPLSDMAVVTSISGG